MLNQASAANREHMTRSLDSETIESLAYHEAGHAVVCFVLYGEQVIKSVSLYDREGISGHTSTYSRLPIPLVCRPPMGAPRRGNPAPVSPDAILDAHGVWCYAGLAAEQLRSDDGLDASAGLRAQEARCDLATLTPAQHRRCRIDREGLAEMAGIMAATRSAEEFFMEYWREARRLLGRHWAAVDALAQELIDKTSLHGDRVDRVVAGFTNPTLDL